MSIAANIRKITEELPSHVQLVAVTKTHPPELIRQAYDSGIKVFGENKVQEMQSKQPMLPADIQWHLIGHLQSNKIKYISSYVSLIHSIDSLKLLAAVNKEGIKQNRVIPCLLQVYIAREESKFGLSEEELFSIINDPAFKSLNNVKVAGLMGMASFTSDMQVVRREFRSLKILFDKMKSELNESFSILSMGMSSDYHVAIEEGSTMVRIGGALFGTRI